MSPRVGTWLVSLACLLLGADAFVGTPAARLFGRPVRARQVRCNAAQTCVCLWMCVCVCR